MIEGVSLQDPVFVNTVGHASGLLLFGLLIVLLLKSWDRTGTRQQISTLLAACLAFLWNLGSLAGLEFTRRGGQIDDRLVAVNFSALSILPAILLAVILKRKYPVLARLGYLISACAVLLHFAELQFPSERLHEAALLLVTVGFGALLITLLVLSRRGLLNDFSLTDIVCLLLFTSSFLHFAYGHSRTAWASEVTWHHAGIPLVLIVLLRDYRLLFLETFIRFVANMGLAGLFAACLYWANESGRLLSRARGNPFAVGLLLISLCCSLVLFAYLRSLAQKRLTRHVFRRGDLNLCSKQILQAASEAQTEQELLDRCACHISDFFEAQRFQVVPALADGRSRTAVAGDTLWGRAELPLRFSRGDSLTLVLGPRRGSRRYLTEDLEALTFLCGLLVEQVERFRANELQRLAVEAELRALQAQVNPHFLFNALNTLYGTIGRESLEARRLVLNLAELFRYCLQQNRTLITLGEELEIVRAYLEIESLRLGDRLAFEISASRKARQARIPVLSVQPLVENAIKHGISRLSANGLVQVRAEEADGMLHVEVCDNGPGFNSNGMTSGLGLGLENVRQRLRLCFGPASVLKIRSTRDGCTATLCIALAKTAFDRSSAPSAGLEAASVR
ncbi:MAG TPA: histidine kinase [Bryobacteraceae bacterium]|jgi:hypothetical protein|nr:histidine kinase [Bryobacteraceae bacterium]